jgi:transposase
MSKGKIKRRKFDREFKMEAVRLVTEKGRSVAEVAKNLGFHENLLHKWKRQYLEDTGNAFPGKGKLKPDAEELRRLKKKLADVTEERDILKKALAYFAEDQK